MSAIGKSTLVKIGAKAEWEEGVRSTHVIRNFEPFSMDEPKSLGGTDTGANPLEHIAAALNGCKAVMIPIIAKEQNFTFSNIRLETVGTLDARGLMGDKNVKTYFQEIDFVLEIETKESDERINKLKEAVEARCPVYNLFTDAGIPVKVTWKKI